MNPDSRPPGTAIGFDFGARRIGVAVAEPAAGTASALTVVRNAAGAEPHWPGIDRIVNEWQPSVLVVGLPLDADGATTAMSEAATAFAATLRARFELDVVLVDEFRSSAEAAERLRNDRRAGTRRRRVGKGDIDAVAAQVILETWMSGRGRTAS